MPTPSTYHRLLSVDEAIAEAQHAMQVMEALADHLAAHPTEEEARDTVSDVAHILKQLLPNLRSAFTDISVAHRCVKSRASDIEAASPQDARARAALQEERVSLDKEKASLTSEKARLVKEKESLQRERTALAQQRVAGRRPPTQQQARPAAPSPAAHPDVLAKLGQQTDLLSTVNMRLVQICHAVDSEAEHARAVSSLLHQLVIGFDHASGSGSGPIAPASSDAGGGNAAATSTQVSAALKELR